MLNGEYFHQCDQKFRLRLPAKLKKEFSEGCYITKGNDGCLFIFSSKQFESLMQKLDSLPLFDSKAQKPLRLLLSSAFEVEEDNQGRVMIPQNLRSFANLTKDIVVIGSGTHAEIWSAEAWDAYNDEEDFDNVIGVLADIDMED